MAPDHNTAGGDEDVFGDEYEIDEFDGFVGDGFRPAESVEADGPRQGGEEEQVDGQPIRTVSAHYASRPISPLSTRTPSIASNRPLRNSIRKPTGVENPFASPEDGEGAPSLQFEPAADMAHRSVSSASSHHFASTGSVRFGAGPSHPYNMYTQGTLARTASMATESTVRAPARRTSIEAEPQHPYSMYPQGLGEDLDDEPVPNAAVPLGFTAVGTSFQRRLGPDGEEQDIIGADGHTEQLPPYTRYPEDGPEKMPLLTVPAPPTALHSRAPVAGTDPTMALMHDPILPPPTPQLQSMSDDSTLRNSRTRSPGIVESNNDSSSSDSLLSKKAWSEKSWKEKRKTKVCGVPFWWILLGTGVTLFVTIVISGVIGGFFAHQKAEQHGPSGPVTSLYDASAISTPIATAPPTGTYQLSLSTPQETQAACLPNTAQQVAWSCDIAGTPAQGIVVDQPVAGNSTGAFIFYNSHDGTVSYGIQQVFMQTSWAPFINVTDNDNPANGPAYYFQQFYDKVVVLPESALAAPNSKNKRQGPGPGFTLDQGWLQQKTVAQPGERPWFCVWNNTFVEGFIYVQLPIATSYVLTSTSTSSPPGPTNTGPAVASTTPTSLGMSTVTETITRSSTTKTITVPASRWSEYTSYTAVNGAEPTSGWYNNAVDNSGSHQKRQSVDCPVYPYVVKLEERRLPNNNVQPYCQQYQILNDGQYNIVADSNGNPIIIYLDEVDPGFGAYQSAGLASTKKSRRGLVPGGCHCQWMSGQSTNG